MIFRHLRSVIFGIAVLPTILLNFQRNENYVYSQKGTSNLPWTQYYLYSENRPVLIANDTDENLNSSDFPDSYVPHQSAIIDKTVGYLIKKYADYKCKRLFNYDSDPDVAGDYNDCLNVLSETYQAAYESWGESADLKARYKTFRSYIVNQFNEQMEKIEKGSNSIAKPDII